MPHSAFSTVEVQIGPQGRVVIPATIRKTLDLSPGDKLVARVDGDSIVFERREALISRLQARFDHVGNDVSLSDQLVLDRQSEASRENNN